MPAKEYPRCKSLILLGPATSGPMDGAVTSGRAAAAAASSCGLLKGQAVARSLFALGITREGAESARTEQSRVASPQGAQPSPGKG